MERGERDASGTPPAKEETARQTNQFEGEVTQRYGNPPEPFWIALTYRPESLIASDASLLKMSPVHSLLPVVGSPSTTPGCWRKDSSSAPVGRRRASSAQSAEAASGHRMEQALIWSIPDFSKMDEGAMRIWWQEAAKLPEDMFPSSEN